MASASTADREWTLATRGQTSLVKDKWQFVELSFDPHSRGGKLKFYIDGRMEGESDSEGRPKARESGEPSSDVYVGRGDGTRFFIIMFAVGRSGIFEKMVKSAIVAGDAIKFNNSSN